MKMSAAQQEMYRKSHREGQGEDMADADIEAMICGTLPKKSSMVAVTLGSGMVYHEEVGA
jgi:hypothetical protein